MLPDLTNAIFGELRQLRRGRGVHGDNITQAVGPALRQLAGIADTDLTAEARAKLIDVLRDLTVPLQHDLRIAADAALAISAEADGESLERRMEWVTAQLDRDKRTVARRIDAAFRRMSEDAVARLAEPRRAQDGWYVDRFDAVLRLDCVSPEAIEDREIVVTASRLDEIVLSTTVPRQRGDTEATHGLDVEVIHGGVLTVREQPSDSNFRSVLTLPAPLRRDERHRYKVITRVPAGQPMRPHYVYVPIGRCESFVLRVRFPLTGPPSAVWRLDGVPAWTIDDEPTIGDPVTPDRSGEVYAEFTGLREGRGYGFKWTG